MVFRYSMSEEKFETLQEQAKTHGFSITTAAQDDFSSIASGEGDSNEQEEEAVSFFRAAAAEEGVEEMYRGGAPFVSGDAQAWYNGLVGHMAPIGSTQPHALVMISELFNARNFPEDAQIEDKKQVFIQALRQLCPSRALPGYDKCTNHAVDPPVPCTVSGLSAPANGALDRACAEGQPITNGTQCALTCDPGYTLSGEQPSCRSGSFSLGSVSCTAEDRVGLSKVDSIGDRIDRAFTRYVSQPLSKSQAESQGWRPAPDRSGCDGKLGYAFTVGGRRVKETPVSLYFTAAGQISGISVDVYEGVESNLEQLGYFENVGSGVHRVTVAFRETNRLVDICQTSTTFSQTVGSQILIGPNTIAEHLPLTSNDAESRGYNRGSCFNGMGWHYFQDLSVAHHMSWESKNLMPVVPMYNPTDGTINAFFFAASHVQSWTSSNQWEPIPLFNFAMCNNFCDNDCTFSGTSAWSTMHFYLNDHDAVTCTDSPEISWCMTGIGCCY